MVIGKPALPDMLGWPDCLLLSLPNSNQVAACHYQRKPASSKLSRNQNLACLFSQGGAHIVRLAGSAHVHQPLPAVPTTPVVAAAAHQLVNHAVVDPAQDEPLNPKPEPLRTSWSIMLRDLSLQPRMSVCPLSSTSLRPFFSSSILSPIASAGTHCR